MVKRQYKLTVDSYSGPSTANDTPVIKLKWGKGEGSLNFRLAYLPAMAKKMTMVSPCCGRHFDHAKGSTLEGKNFRCSGCQKKYIYPQDSPSRFKIDMAFATTPKVENYFIYWLSRHFDMVESHLLAVELAQLVDDLTLPERQRREAEAVKAREEHGAYLREQAEIHRGEQTCSRCHKYIPLESVPHHLLDSSTYCDGLITLGTNPYAVEIYGDHSESWDCRGNRYDAAQDI